MSIILVIVKPDNPKHLTPYPHRGTPVANYLRLGSDFSGLPQEQHYGKDISPCAKFRASDSDELGKGGKRKEKNKKQQLPVVWFFCCGFKLVGNWRLVPDNSP